MATFNISVPGTPPLIEYFDKMGDGVPVPYQRRFYFQRAWNTVTLSYETWISEGSPSPTPPSGDPIQAGSLTTAMFWKRVV